MDGREGGREGKEWKDRRQGGGRGKFVNEKAAHGSERGKSKGERGRREGGEREERGRREREGEGGMKEGEDEETIVLQNSHFINGVP